MSEVQMIHWQIKVIPKLVLPATSRNLQRIKFHLNQGIGPIFPHQRTPPDPEARATTKVICNCPQFLCGSYRCYGSNGLEKIKYHHNK